jgi:hypothetical protein
MTAAKLDRGEPYSALRNQGFLDTHHGQSRPSSVLSSAPISAASSRPSYAYPIYRLTRSRSLPTLASNTPVGVSRKPGS